MSVPIQIRISSPQLAALNADLETYARLSGKAMEEVVDKKGQDLGIQLYKGFRQVRWKGKGIAYREFRRRVKAGQGIKVRERMLLPRWSGRVPMFQVVNKRGVRAGRDAKGNYPTSLWQRLVAQELARRQAGQGALAASFLWFRRRSNNARGTFLVRNKAGGSLGFAETSPGSFRIVGMTPGLAKIDARYGIVNGAIGRVRADMDIYIQRKLAGIPFGGKRK